ncbi:hypothetical protein BX600DRAFT_523006 [Xylariales sp. PMI_506]|nr:hypothetical protein BX600DRAFT_523006 [Xylariales sp. PMI_506]
MARPKELLWFFVSLWALLRPVTAVLTTVTLATEILASLDDDHFAYSDPEPSTLAEALSRSAETVRDAARSLQRGVAQTFPRGLVVIWDDERQVAQQPLPHQPIRGFTSALDPVYEYTGIHPLDDGQSDIDACNSHLDVNILNVTSFTSNSIKIDNVPKSCMAVAARSNKHPINEAVPVTCGSTCLFYDNLSEREHRTLQIIFQQYRESLN